MEGRRSNRVRRGARMSWRFTLAALAWGLVGSTRVDAQDVLAPAAWLGGCWELRAGARVTTEQWMAPHGGMMPGMSRTVVRDTVREFEFLRIQSRAGQVAYLAQPSGRPETAFAAALLSDTLLVFRNPAHDFPQQISYRKVTRDSLVARIEGPPGGTARAINFPMRRVSCPGGSS